MKLTHKLEKEIRIAYQAFWQNLFSVNINTLNTLLDDDFRQIATTEAEVFFTKKDALNFLKLTEDQLLGNIELRNQNIKIESLDTYFLLTDLCDGFVKINNEWDFYAKVRNTFLLHKTGDGWKFILQHTSLPDHRTEEGETVALKKIEKENLDLRDAVKRRTVEIENKNRQLEIEAALERVRSRSMAMHDSSDLSGVVFAIFTELVKLDAQLDRCLILIVNPETFGITWYLTGKEGLLSNNGFLVQNNQHPSHRAYLDGWRSKRKKWQYILAGEEKKQTDAFIFTQTQLSQLPDFIKADMKSVETIHLTISSDNFGCLIASSISPLSEAHADIVEKFTIVFNQTYTRFLDLQKAEEQAKEAHIELALERVRARAMAMHTSQELKEVALELRKQMGLLGQKDLEICAIHLYDNENSFESWSAMKAPDLEGEILQTQARFPNKGIQIVDELMIQFKKGTRDYIVVNEGEKIVEWLNVLKTHAPTIHSSIMQSKGKLPVKKLNSNWSVADFAGGALVMVTYTEPDVQSRYLLRRTANVFEQAYIRFNDLKKAEAQAIEAQIEVSMEKVRSRSLAMQKPEELTEVAELLRKEMGELGVEALETSSIYIIGENEHAECWYAIKDVRDKHTKRVSDEMLLKLTDTWVGKQMWTFYQSKQEHTSIIMKGENRKEWINYCAAHSKVLQGYYGEEIPERTYHLVKFKGGYMGAASPGEISTESKDLLKRMAAVFSLAYTRFKDLQEAAAREREAQIELALERVRARTMAMQQSAELPQAANLLFKQVQSLDMPAWSAGYCIWDDDKQGITLWMSSEGVMQPSFHAPLTKDPSFIHMREAYEKGEPFHVEEVGGKALLAHYTYMRTLPVVGDVLDSIIEAGHPLPTYQIFHCVYFSQGFLLFITYEPVPNAHDIFKRFGKVFEQTYTRFLDLQKAEAQAREAQIEVALERVRSRSLAMQKSDELLEAGEILFSEMQKLGIESLTAGFVLMDKEEKSGLNYTPDPSTKKIMSLPVIIPHNETIHMQRVLENWKKGTSHYVVEMDEEETIKHQTFIAERSTNFTLNAEQLIAISPARLFLHNFYFKEGYLLIVGGTRLSAEQIDIMLRFAKVFQQTYTRFLDLQKAEAQAREAQIELGLERVRARAMAMQHSDELAELVTIVFKELTQLDFNITSSIIWINNTESITNTLWVTSSEMNRPALPIFLTSFHHPFFPSIIQAWKKEDPKWIYKLEGAEKSSFEKSFFKGAPGLPKALKVALTIPEKVVFSASFNNFGALELIGKEPLSDEKFDILHRFGKVFNSSYTRFNDLKKAEAQARESQIQLALERVRARTMAMHHSSELADTAKILFQQIKELGYEMWSCGFGIWKPEVDLEEAWMSTGDLFPIILLPFKEDPSHLGIYEASQRGESVFEVEVKGEILTKHYNWLMSQPSFKIVFSQIENSGVVLPTVQWKYAAFFKQGYLHLITTKPQPDIHNISRRFAKVFEQTYTRFLDLQKAEAQAKEAQIEAALERVRSRTMGMQRSEQLGETASLLFNQFADLGIHVWSSGFQIWKDDNISTNAWMSSAGGEVQSTGIRLPHTEDPYFINIYNARNTPDCLFVMESKGKELEETYRYMFNIPEWKKQFGDIESSGFPIPKYQITHCIYFTHGYLMLITHESYPEYWDIFKRFGKVFDQTYTRFQDLQKAEAQAREAQIEASLERVRARTMAMRGSDELLDVASILFQQVKALGVPLWNCGFNIWDIGDQEFTYYPGTPDGIISQSPCKIPLTEHPVFKSFDESRKRGDELFIYEKEGEMQRGHYQYMLSLPGVGDVLQSMLDSGFEFPVFQIDHVVNFAYGNLIFITYEHFPEMHDVFKRFAKVFEQTYTRFLDLQKAEAQAREAQIEAALERVRSRTMAMQRSEELPEVAALLFQQVKTLGVPQFHCGFNIFEIDDKECTWYPGSADGDILPPCKIPLTEHPVFMAFIESRKRGDELFVYEKEGEYQAGHYRYMLSLPVLGEILQNMLDAGIPFPTFQIDHLANFSHGNLLFITSEHFPEMHETFKRFAKVFEQTYTRFLDLQKAEAQAREAQIEAALERVRSRTMAMQKSEELREVVCDFFNQMYPLGFAQWGFALMLVDEAQKGFNFWLSAPNGRILPESYYLPKLEHRASELLWSAYSNQLPVSYLELKDEEKLSWDLLLFEKSGFAKFPDSVKEEMLAIPYVMGTLVSMRYGLMEAIDVNPLPEELVTILQRFAKVFEQTYTRFLDLEKAEAQAREAKVQLALERVRARTMAMQKSEELAEVSYLLNKQVVKLGIPTWGCAFNIYNENDSTEWFSNLEGTIPAYHTPRENIFLKYYEAGQRGESLLIEEFAGERIKELYKYFASLNDSENETITEHVAKAPDYQINHMAYFKYGYLLFVTFVPAPEAHDIFKRFAKEFEQTYTRFLDLQKAEAQAREAQIQLSLERIRAKAMAMQHSDELSDFLTVVFEQFDVLNLSPVNCHLSFFDLDNNRITFRLTGKKGATLIASQEIDMDASPLWKQKVDDWKSGNFKDVDVLYTPFENLPEIGEIFKEILSKLPEDDLPLPEDYPNGQYVTEGYYKYGYLGYSASQPASDEEKEITRRIANEFGNVYQRFLDLQKAEEQARESQIQLSLERIRAKAMSMQHSDELSDFLTILFQQFEVLNLSPVNCQLSLIDIDNNRSTFRMTGKNGFTLIASQEVDIDASPVWKQKMEDWKSGHPNDVDVLYIPFENLQEVAGIFKEVLSKLPEDERPLPDDFPDGDYVVEGYCKYGYIGYNASRPPTVEEKEITRRIANEFGNVYQRFLDLQKAEAQAREARIQLSLERIRAKAMAMQQTDELSDFLTVLFGQFGVLNLDPVFCHLSFFDIENNRFTYRMTGRTGAAVIATQEIDLEATPLWKQNVEDWKSGQPYQLGGLYIPKERIPEITEIFNEILSKLPEEERPKIEDFPDGQYVVDGYCKYGYLGYSSSRPPSDEENEITRRIANEFGNVYQRFLDLQKAEEQAKEAQIEASLEKVRSRSLAMQNSEELVEVAELLRKEMGHLGVEELETSSIYLVDKKNEQAACWYAIKDIRDGNKKLLSDEMTLLLHDTWVGKEMWKFYQSEKEQASIVMKGPTRKEWINYCASQSQDLQGYYGSEIPERTYHLVKFNGGYMGAASPGDISTESWDLLKRAAAVFSFAYTRFKDLQDAAARARETQIELALERVRARTMAMHKSDELFDIILVVSEQLLQLNIKFSNVSFGVNNPDYDMRLWMAVNGYSNAYPIQWTFIDNPGVTRLKEAQHQPDKVFSDVLTQKENNEWLQHIFKCNPPFDIFSEKNKVRLLNTPGYARSMIVMKDITLIVGNYAAIPYTDQENEIFKRFVNVFEQSYIRFLDLQKAEAQAREAQIQLSLERIRAKALAMQHSDELSGFLTVLFEQFTVLNLNPVYCNLTFFDIDNNRSTFRMTGKKGSLLIATQEIDLDASPVWKQQIEEWKAGNPNDVDVLYIPFESIPEVVEIFKEILEKLPEDERPVTEDFPNGQYVVQGYCKYGYLGYSAIGPPSDEEKEVTRRIATEFGNVYQRFLDLQKAEAQTREAEIELALERVRARTMAMQKSDELREAVLVIYEQLQQLNFDAKGCNLIIIDKETNIAQYWVSGFSQKIYPESYTVPFLNHPYQNALMKPWKQGEKYVVYEYTGKMKQSYDAIFFTQSEFKNVPDDAKNAMIGLESVMLSTAYISYGALQALGAKPLSEENANILQRFAKVFEQTYTRFLDLQKAEISAQEAIKQSSLDRVRGEIASMRTADDLSRITPVVWHELTALGVPFFRCGVFIIKEKEQLVHVYLSNPEGKSLAVLHLPIDGVELTIHTVDHWRKQQTYTAHWDREQFMAWVQTMQTQGQVQSATTYQGAESPPESLTLQFIPFNQGMLYIGSTDALNEDQLSLAKDLAAAFSVAYARYEDFKTIENTLAELKATQSQLIQSEKMASLGELTAGIAHEIQNPLNFVNNFSEVSNELIAEVFEERKKEPGIRDIELEEELLGDIKENLTKINHHGKRASDIVKGMLEHSRKSSGTKEPTDINALVDENMRLAYHGLRAKYKDFNAKMETHFESNLLKVDVISQDIGRVLLNLFTNAFYAANERSKKEKAGFEPTVSISTKRVPTPSGDGDEHSKNGNIQISITDNGSGIPDAIKDKIFQPFFTTKPTGQGTGLGLSLAYDIVTKGHGGTIEVESVEGKGSEFIVRLPL